MIMLIFYLSINDCIIEIDIYIDMLSKSSVIKFVTLTSLVWI